MYYDSLMDAVRAAADLFSTQYIRLCPLGFTFTPHRPNGVNFVRVAARKAYIEAVLPDRIERTLIWDGSV